MGEFALFEGGGGCTFWRWGGLYYIGSSREEWFLSDVNADFHQRQWTLIFVVWGRSQCEDVGMGTLGWGRWVGDVSVRTSAWVHLCGFVGFVTLAWERWLGDVDVGTLARGRWRGGVSFGMLVKD